MGPIKQTYSSDPESIYTHLNVTHLFYDSITRDSTLVKYVESKEQSLDP